MDQKRIIKKSIIYLKKLKKEKLDITLSPFCYLDSWSNSLGNIKLRLINEEKIKFVEFFIFFKEIIKIGYNHNLRILENNKNLNKLNKNVIVSWCSKNSFDKYGKYHDNYLNISEKKNYIWFLVSTDNFVPKNLQNNISIIYKPLGNFNFLYLIKILSKNLILYGFLTKKFFHYCNYTVNFAENIGNIFQRKYKNTKINLLILFENQPLQNQIINITKKINKNNKTIGYLHCLPWPLQTDLIYKNKNLDKLYVTSKTQKEVLNNNFLWPKIKVKSISSLRYLQKNKLKKKNYIFLPFDDRNIKSYLEILLNFLKKNPKYLRKKFIIKIHPINKSNIKFITYRKIFSKKIELLYKYNKTKNFKKNYSILIGNPGGVAAENLENKNPILHITKNTLFDLFDLKMWRDIRIQNINPDIYEYICTKKNIFTKYGNNKNNNLKIINSIFNAKK
jgi:hypothetical protein